MQTQGTGCVAIGSFAGKNSQNSNSIAIGTSAGQTRQNIGSIAIGHEAGSSTQGSYAIAIGFQAGITNQHDNSIVLNASGSVLNSDGTDRCFIKPVRNDDGRTQALCYDETSGEVTYSTSGTKTFVINHPTDNDKYLVHACLEGPEAGVYYRGKNEIKGVVPYTNINLPSYAKHIASDFTVQITPIYDGTNKPGSFSSTEVNNGKFTVFGTPGKFFWHVTGKRNSIVVEPDKDKVKVHGDGPYKYIAKEHQF